MKINKYILFAVAILLLLVMGWREYGHYSEKKAMEMSYEAVIDFKEGETKQLKSSLDLKVADVFIMKQNRMSEKVAKQQLERELEGYKDITAYMKSEVITSIRNLEAKYEQTDRKTFDGILINDGYILKEDVEKHFMRTPKTFTYKDEWMAFAGTVNKKSAMLDSLYLLNKFDATIGYMAPDSGSFRWLRKKQPVVSLKSYNPYTKIVYVNNVVVDNDKGKVGNILLSRPAMFLYGFVGGGLFLN